MKIEAMRQTLTSAERAVADLVAVGMTNREVAARLQISPKTVEWKLTKIYRTLGLRSRAELAAHYTRLTYARAQEGEQ